MLNLIEKKRYITGWFSPTDPQMMVEFYEIRPQHFQAEVLKGGELINQLNADHLARLQTDVLNRFGGSIKPNAHNRTALPRARSL